MDCRTQAKTLYSEVRCADREDDRADELKLQQVKVHIQQHLHSSQPDSRFQFREFVTIISDSSAMPYFHPTKASKAFQNLEICLILILRYPWKAEYKTVKKYTGFFQTKIEAHLQNAPSIFKLVGYSEEKEGILTLERRINQDVILAVAFECLVAAEECLIINATYTVLNDRMISYAHVVRVRSTHLGNAAQMAVIVKKDLPYRSDHLLRGRRIDTDMNTDTPSVGKLPDQLDVIKKTLGDSVHVPYADDEVTSDRPDLKEATFEEHCMASLRLLQEDVVRPKVDTPPRPVTGSVEWSFVRDDLKNKFGLNYFEGTRGDVLKGDEMVDQEALTTVQEVRITDSDNRPPRPHVASHRDSGYPESYQPIYYPPTADTGYGSTSKLATSSTSYKAMPSSSVGPLPPTTHQLPTEHYMQTPRGHVGSTSDENVHVNAIRQRMVPLLPSRSPVYREYPTTSDTVQGNLLYPQLIPSSGRKTFPSSLPRRTDTCDNKRPLTKSTSLKSPSETAYRFPNVGQRPLPDPPSGGAVIKEFVTEQSYNTAPSRGPYVVSRSAPIVLRDTSVVLEPRIGKLAISDPAINWSCTFCTILNTNGVMICSACGKSRNYDKSDNEREVTIRKCERCTYENSPSATVCHMCSSDTLSAVQSSV